MLEAWAAVVVLLLAVLQVARRVVDRKQVRLQEEYCWLQPELQHVCAAARMADATPG